MRHDNTLKIIKWQFKVKRFLNSVLKEKKMQKWWIGLNMNHQNLKEGTAEV